MSIRAPGAGRPRKPTALHIVQGTARPHRHGDRGKEPQFDGAIERPEWLSPMAVEFWGEMSPRLIAAKVLTAGDVPAFAALCESWATWRQMNEAIKKAGPVHLEKDDEGRLVGSTVSALFKVRSKAWEELNKGLSQFGLTPADRSRVVGTIDGDKPANPFARFG